MKMMRLTTFLLCLAAVPAAAQTSADGITYAADCNYHGAILRDITQVASPLILGASCDAVTSEWGEGRWGADKSGFVAIFDDKKINFPSQEYPCGKDSDPDPYFGLSCGIPK